MEIDMKQSDDFPSRACAATARVTNAILELQAAIQEVEGLGYEVYYWGTTVGGTNSKYQIRDVQIGVVARIREGD